ncbi:MAG: membrane protein insertion efficiency factor YidD [Alphaproteobacteria bacterium]
MAAKGGPAARPLSLAARGLSVLIHGYRLLISPWIGPRCRFLPTCSDYALDALARHGAIRGGWLTVRRLARCHPFGGSGFDPVPDVVSPPERQGSRLGQDRRRQPTYQRAGLQISRPR